MDKAYVSEFTNFINRYLEEHPEEIEAQRRGWDFYWSPEIDPGAPEISKDDLVPDDNYGFTWPVVHAESAKVEKPAGSGGSK